MKHLGDICKINGAEIEPVWCITGGSPCQDLSIAGKRAGLAGARSGLFMEQVRIAREMREEDRKNGRTGELIRPRYLVWENVPGAFSSNKGKDFAAVLEEIIRIVEPEAAGIDVPAKGWPTWGGYHDCMGGRWSVAWRVHDAQYWGVPQRRRRISLVADFGGDTAGEILFDRKSVLGDFAESGAPGERLAAAAQESAAYAVRIRGGCDGGGKGALVQTEKSGTLGTGNDQTIFCMATQQGGAELRTDDRAPTLTAAAGMSGNNQPVVCAGFKLGNSEQARSIGYQEERSPTLNAECGGNKPAVLARTYKDPHIVAYPDVADSLCAESYPSKLANKDIVNGCYPAVDGGNGMVVRRLTPLECERLQGYPDGWTDIGEWTDEKGKKHKEADSPRYKALGNSIALPFWEWMLRRMARYLPEGATLGSLFDGIGGFPLIFERIHGEGTARWASEIEQFPIAVTKIRFPEEREDGI